MNSTPAFDGPSFFKLIIIHLEKKKLLYNVFHISNHISTIFCGNFQINWRIGAYSTILYQPTHLVLPHHQTFGLSLHYWHHFLYSAAEFHLQ